jgi:predicted nucleic-acid-binding Zn-ribbon protein
MPSWVLSCPNCKNAFEHSKINDYKLSDFLDPQKPAVPVEGDTAQCPNCGYRTLYRRYDLTYRASTTSARSEPRPKA